MPRSKRVQRGDARVRDQAAAGAAARAAEYAITSRASHGSRVDHRQHVLQRVAERALEAEVVLVVAALADDVVAGARPRRSCRSGPCRRPTAARATSQRGCRRARPAAASAATRWPSARSGRSAAGSGATSAGDLRRAWAVAVGVAQRHRLARLERDRRAEREQRLARARRRAPAARSSRRAVGGDRVGRARGRRRRRTSPPSVSKPSTGPLSAAREDRQRRRGPAALGQLGDARASRASASQTGASRPGCAVRAREVRVDVPVLEPRRRLVRFGRCCAA